MGSLKKFPRLFLDKKPLKIEKLLGEGAFAQVFLTSCAKEKRAVKVLKSFEPGTLELFKQEFLLGKSFCHPCFVQAFHLGWSESGAPFYTMEYLSGTDLKKLWPKLDFVSKKLLCCQLFLGLSLLHKKGLVHRDLKPSNLLVVTNPTDRLLFQLKIMDLGLTRHSNPESGENVGGTVDYLAPETIRKEKVDAGADFYATGIILAELFLGHPPYSDKDPAVTLARHQEATLPKLPIRSRKEKEFWEKLIYWLAAKDRTERPSTGQELLAFLLEDPVLKKRVSRQPESIGDWCQTLIPRFWASLGFELDEKKKHLAEVPKTLSRAKEELLDRQSVQKKETAIGVQLGFGSSRDQIAYPRFSPTELQNFLQTCFGFTKEAAKTLWLKTSGEVSLVESELKFWQKEKLLGWEEMEWKIDENNLKDISASPFTEKERLAIVQTLPAGHQELLARLALFWGTFKTEEIKSSGLWPKENLDSLFEDLLNFGFLEKDENGFVFSRPGLREALYNTLTKTGSAHRKIWDCFEKQNQLQDKNRAFEFEYQTAGAGLWEPAAKQAVRAAEEANAQEDFKAALWYLNRAQKWSHRIPSRNKRDELLMAVLQARGTFFGQQGELDLAIAEYSELAQLAKKMKNLEEEAHAYNRLGNIFRQKPDFPAAEKALKKALLLFERLGKELNASHCHNNLGATYAHQHRYEEALRHYHQAADIQKRLGATRNLASTMNNIGVVFAFRDELKEAGRYFGEGLQLNRQLGEKEEIARCLNNVAFILIQQGKFQEVQRLLQEAIELNRQIGNQKEEIFNLDNLALCFYRRGNYAQAIAHALQGLSLAEKISYQGNHSSLYCSLGASLKNQGQYAEAEKYLLRALDQAKELKDRPSETLAILEIGDLRLHLNDIEKAKEMAHSGLGRTQNSSERALRGRFYSLLGRIHAACGDRSGSEKYFIEAENRLSQSEHQADRQEVALERSEALALKETDQKIDELLALVRTFSIEGMSAPQVCKKLFLEASFLLEKGRLADARDKAAEALKIAYDLNEPEKIWRLHHFLGGIWAKEKNFQKVFSELKAAAQVLHNLKENFPTEASFNRYFEDPQKIALLSEIQKVAQALTD